MFPVSNNKRLRLTLVLATPISGPALMWTPQWDSLLMVEPTVLVTPTTSAPLLQLSTHPLGIVQCLNRFLNVKAKALVGAFNKERRRSHSSRYLLRAL